LKLKKIIRFLAKIALGLIIASIVTVIFYRFIPVPVTPLMVIRYFEMEEGKIDKDWEPLEKISPSLPLAVISSEDQKFDEHYGFDIEAIEKAAKYNERHKGKKVKGASTISQQTAKNVFLWPSRSWIRKGLEVYFTLLIEIFWSKERIMEVYLNVIEMGPGVYGAEAAANYYFKKPAVKLTRSECALIAAILPNPRKWSASKPTPYIVRRKGRIMKRMQSVSFLKE
jgi:monofunctional biosynthetic peptidoglycan transglycosylase